MTQMLSQQPICSNSQQQLEAEIPRFNPSNLKDFQIKVGKLKVNFTTYFDLEPVQTKSKYQDNIYLWESTDSRWLIRYCQTLDGIILDDPFKLMIKNEGFWDIPGGKYVFISLRVAFKYLMKRILREHKLVKSHTHPLIVKTQKILKRKGITVS
jgi:hypothetical protein